MLKEENMAMPYEQHQRVVTRRWCRYSWSEERTSIFKEENVAMPYRQHHEVVTRRWCRYYVTRCYHINQGILQVLLFYKDQNSSQVY